MALAEANLEPSFTFEAANKLLSMTCEAANAMVALSSSESLEEANLEPSLTFLAAREEPSLIYVAATVIVALSCSDSLLYIWVPIFLPAAAAWGMGISGCDCTFHCSVAQFVTTSSALG